MKEKTTIPARQEDIRIIKDTASGKGLKKKLHFKNGALQIHAQQI